MSVYLLRFCLKQFEEYLIYNLPYFETCSTEVKFYGLQYLDMSKNYCHGRGDLPLRVGVHHCGYHFGIRTKTGTVKKRIIFRACLHGGGGSQVGEVTRLGGVTRLSI